MATASFFTYNFGQIIHKAPLNVGSLIFLILVIHP